MFAFVSNRKRKIVQRKRFAKKRGHENRAKRAICQKTNLRAAKFHVKKRVGGVSEHVVVFVLQPAAAFCLKLVLVALIGVRSIVICAKMDSVSIPVNSGAIISPKETAQLINMKGTVYSPGFLI